MFALRQRILRPAASCVAKRSFCSSNASCLSVAIEPPLLLAPLESAPQSSICVVSNLSQVQFSPSLLSTSKVLGVSTTSAAASNWFISALQNHLEDGLFWISTLKRRRKMMNKHKLRKRRKKNRMKNKK